MIKLVIIDLDDTIYDNYGVVFPRAKEAVCKALSADENFPENDWKKILSVMNELYENNEPKYRQIFAKLFDQYNVEAEDIRERFLKISHEIYLSHIDVSGIEVFPGVKEMIERLRAKYKVVLLTKGNDEQQNRKIDSLGVRDWFDDIVITAEFGRDKEQDIDLLLGKYHVEEDGAILVGDRPDTDIKAANAAGIKSIRVWQCKYEKIQPKDDREKATYDIKNVLDAEKIINEL